MFLNLTGSEAAFKSIGGEFITNINVISEKYQHIKAFLFDWDGVFNNGDKGQGVTSSFTEADAMGLNLLRYEFYTRHQKLPKTGIITGQINESAKLFAEREKFNNVYFKALNKMAVVKEFAQANQLQLSEIAWFFDDVLDLEVAKNVGLRFWLQRPKNPLFKEFIITNQLVDYVTANSGGQHGIREVCELLISLNGNFEKTLMGRMNFTPDYINYFKQRQAIEPVITEIKTF